MRAIKFTTFSSKARTAKILKAMRWLGYYSDQVGGEYVDFDQLVETNPKYIYGHEDRSVSLSDDTFLFDQSKYSEVGVL